MRLRAAAWDLARACRIARLVRLAIDARAETLQEALSAAYKFNPRLDAARATLRATDEEVPRAISGYRPDQWSATPTPAISMNTMRPSGGPGQRNDESNPRGYSVDAGAADLPGLPHGQHACREAEATVRAGRETLRTTESSVLLEAVTAYMDVVRDQAIVRLRENNVTVLTRDLKATQDRFNVGEVTRTDVAQAQARRAAAVSALDLARANLKTSRATFERVVGHPPSDLVEPRPADSVPKIAEREHRDFSAREPQRWLRRSTASRPRASCIDLIRGELLPTVQLEASYDRRFDPSSRYRSQRRRRRSPVG